MDFRSRLCGPKPLLLDAAMGTELERRGLAAEGSLWSARGLIDAPEAVREIHAADAAAGADILTANTFRTHRRSLAPAGLADEAARLTHRAVELAREAARGRTIFVAGSLSPLGDCYRPDLVPADAALEVEHQEQARALAGAGVDVILLETFNSCRELGAALRAARATGLPVVASIVTDGQGRLLSGERIEEAVREVEPMFPDALAINCVPARRLSADLRILARTLRGLRSWGAWGNLGCPDPAGRLDEPASPEQLASLAREWSDAGVRIVGGCCGTTASHTAALRRMIDAR